MIGYFFILTIFLPNNLKSKPTFLKKGDYVTYKLEDLGSNNEIIQNGTYTWKITSISTDATGKIIATINETFTGDSEWGGYKHSIPPTGRVTEIDLTEGNLNGLHIWLGNYYNDYLFSRTIFKFEDITFEGSSFTKMSLQGKERTCIRVTAEIPAYYRTSSYYYEKETGILVASRYGFREIHMRMTLVETNINFESTVLSEKSTLDLLLILPFFIFPLLGGIIGLWYIKRKNISFTRNYWLFFSITSAIALSYLTNFPIPIRWQYSPLFLSFVSLNLTFWFSITYIGIEMIDRFIVKIIEK